MTQPLQPLVMVPVDLVPTLQGQRANCEVCGRLCWRDLEAEVTALGLARRAGARMVRICDRCHGTGRLEELVR